MRTKITPQSEETIPCIQFPMGGEENLFNFIHDFIRFLHHPIDFHGTFITFTRSERSFPDRSPAALRAGLPMSTLAQTAQCFAATVGNTMCASDARKASDAAHR